MPRLEEAQSFLTDGMNFPKAEVKFLTDACSSLMESLQVLKWTYAYSFFYFFSVFFFETRFVIIVVTKSGDE